MGVRWTIGAAHPRGFEALKLSISGAARLFGPEAAYVVCVNGIAPDEARARTGDVPVAVDWRPCEGLPEFLLPFLDHGMAEGVAWKFAPLRLFPDRFELALDNDCILWDLPEALEAWLAAGAGDRCVLAEDVRPCFGQFADLCPPHPLNTGIRGLPPGFDLARAMQGILEARPAGLASELDEQGLQVAALSRAAPPLIVRLDEVTVCSPFWPHLAELGRCGAHFVGLNVRQIPFDHYDRPGDAWMAEHWARHRPALYRAVGLEAPDECISAGGPPARSPAEFPAPRGRP